MKTKVILCIAFFVVVALYCDRNKVIEFNYASKQIMMEINSVSPNGRYAIISIVEDTIGDLKIQYVKPMQQPSLVNAQMVLDLEKQNWWQLLNYPLVDTIQYYNADYFVWSKDIKSALFSVAITYPNDTFELFPIYLADLEKRSSTNLNIPYLGTTFYRIPLFSQRNSEIVFWSSGFTINDTLQLSYIPIGGIFKWDTLQRSLNEMKKGEDIASVDWMHLYDTTFLFMERDGILSSFSFITGEIEPILPEIRISGVIKQLDAKIAFVGSKTDIKRNIYVYDMAKRELELTLSDVGKKALNVDVNRQEIVPYAVEIQSGPILYYTTQQHFCRSFCHDFPMLQ